VAIYTDHQIFDRFYNPSYFQKKNKDFGVTLKQLNAFEIGDYITHIDHGIGKFDGLRKIEVEGKIQEAIKLVYEQNDLLYVSIHSLYKIARYNPKEGIPPKLNKLGSNAWKTLKNKTKTKLKEIAFNLVELYAKRKSRKGFAFLPDNYLQDELEASFFYEDTPDQLKATEEVKADMESDKCMDRLICGDVGFGKTEVAIRAAFKATCSNKQVAILVPTTLLAFQHYRSFSQRLKEFSLNVDYLNRFRSTSEKKKVLEELCDGKINILIGTHSLISENVKFKDLGLLIVDEEHKFGVSIKDKLKTFCENLDTLTLSATPIPRTLQFSLIGARDLSIIKTPPANRRPIETQLILLDKEIIKNALTYELNRGGQIFFIHNRVKDLEKVAEFLKELCPALRIGIGHGQTKGKELEDLMLDFINEKFDLLLSTTIVESGLDVPNANTMFINNAQHFGLADLHQIRGRVGRSNIQAFCYLITPPLSSLSDASSKRLRALEQFCDLGSGFQISMKDLEIRGAGNLLGTQQSGFISEMGFETYQKILNEVTQELKLNEFEDLDKNKSYWVSEIQIDTDLQLLLPDGYVNDSMQRLRIYQDLAQIEEENKLKEFENSLKDRFGPLPIEAKELLKSIELKWIAKKLGFEKLVLKKGKMLLFFLNQPNYFKSDLFKDILEFIKKNPTQIVFKERKNSSGIILCYLQVEKINTISKAIEFFEKLKNKVI
jgi:transcription-repair coupling factor (superfamily II helicase)